jgi:hypothetical protein
VFNNLRIKMKMLLKGTPRNPQTKFINPYAMSDTTTEQYRVKPEFRDGRFILKNKRDEPQMRKDVAEDTPQKDVDAKKKEPGMAHFVASVVVKDLTTIAGVSKKKARVQPIIKPVDQVTYSPPAFEPELLEPLDVPVDKLEQNEAMKPEPITITVEPTVEPVVPHVPKGNDIAVANIKRMLNNQKMIAPKGGVK